MHYRMAASITSHFCITGVTRVLPQGSLRETVQVCQARVQATSGAAHAEKLRQTLRVALKIQLEKQFYQANTAAARKKKVVSSKGRARMVQVRTQYIERLKEKLQAVKETTQ